EVAAPLVHVQREEPRVRRPIERDEALKVAVARRQAHVVELAGVPGDHLVVTALGPAPEAVDQPRELVDPTVPVPPLGSVDASAVPGEPGLLDPRRLLAIERPDRPGIR